MQRSLQTLIPQFGILIYIMNYTLNGDINSDNTLLTLNYD